MQFLAVLLMTNQQLTRLAPVDVLILVLYFALVVFLGHQAYITLDRLATMSAIAR